MMATANGMPWILYAQAIVIMLSASTEPTDRSMPPMMMTIAAPTAITPMSETWLMMLIRLRKDRKKGDRNDIAMKITTRPINGPGTDLKSSPTRLPDARWFGVVFGTSDAVVASVVCGSVFGMAVSPPAGRLRERGGLRCRPGRRSSCWRRRAPSRPAGWLPPG